MPYKKLYSSAVELLKKLIATPSVSREESGTADAIAQFLAQNGVQGVQRMHNNVWARNLHFDAAKPTILLNSHLDTVKPNPGYARDPFSPDIEDGRLYGLGSNDAGASVVSLLATFLHFYDMPSLAYNLIVAITAEEEVGGKLGVEALLSHLGDIDFAIVGEPTGMQMAIAERGLVVVDFVAHGVSGHAARDEGDNAIYKAIKDIEWLRTYRFPKESELFGPVKMSVTIISSGSQHNVVPAECRFTADIRVTDRYTNEEVVETIRRHVHSDVTPRSTRLRPSYIDPSHPIVKAGAELGLGSFGSPTTSDQSLLPMTSLKIGPGDSARSHSADEYVKLEEIEQGIATYIAMLGKILVPA